MLDARRWSLVMTTSMKWESRILLRLRSVSCKMQPPTPPGGFNMSDPVRHDRTNRSTTSMVRANVCSMASVVCGTEHHTNNKVFGVKDQPTTQRHKTHSCFAAQHEPTQQRHTDMHIHIHIHMHMHIHWCGQLCRSRRTSPTGTRLPAPTGTAALDYRAPRCCGGAQCTRGCYRRSGQCLSHRPTARGASRSASTQATPGGARCSRTAEKHPWRPAEHTCGSEAALHVAESRSCAVVVLCKGGVESHAMQDPQAT